MFFNGAYEGDVLMNQNKNIIASLKNRIFKILPLKEEENENLPVYLDSLKIQIVGMMETEIGSLYRRELYETYCLLQYFSVHDFNASVCKREVFRILHLWEAREKDCEVS